MYYPSKRQLNLKTFRNYKWHFLFILPMIILYCMFTLWPVVGSWYYSLFEWKVLGETGKYVGIANFKDVLFDPFFWNAFWHTLAYALLNVFIQLPTALFLAIILNASFFKGRNIYRLLLFLPVVTNTVVVGIVFSIILNPLGGPLNEVLKSIGIINQPINFLGSQTLAFPTVIMIAVWKNIGVVLVYWLAGLQTIPGELYEAAKIDGAGSRQTFFHITLPLLMPIGVIILLLTFVNNLDPFDLVKSMTEGGPNYATDVVQTYIYRYAFSADTGALPRYGFASSAGIVFGLTVLIITGIQSILLKRFKPYSGSKNK